ncbi:N-acetylmannosamine-6-phosphate 2-epimerase [Haloimpatiens massiliensis]|uniref:N-acetylmannosamine-6-phosphate 2-epimerase n=1 Tax=Haloimpatiens massiliensis TaxID=1658110 RepID=UPI001A9A553E|nr:N-acetylmannosamine-6-phosphate 2-epimerase [Haloimpatiens massiliensis]
MKEDLINKIKGGLIVSCQALEDEPLHSSFIMSKMALAAKIGGAVGIRANTVEDIKAIKCEVDLPIIGIIKRTYGECSVYITPTMKEVDELCKEGVHIIAIDATKRERPDGKKLCEFVKEIKNKYPNQLLMADISDLEEARLAEACGFDFVGTTMHGYTEYTKGMDIQDNDFEFLMQVLDNVKIPVISEGKVDTPEKAKKCLKRGALAVVTGGAITRPQLITKKFVDEINNK